MTFRPPLFALLLLLAAAVRPVTADNDPPWPEGWRFRIAMVLPAPAAQCVVTVRHDGLAQPDGRDLRLFAADGQGLRMQIFATAPDHARLVFAPQRGLSYWLYFGNTDPALPSIPADGMLPGLPADWLPEGGLSCTTYRLPKPLTELRNELMTGRDVVAQVAAAVAFAATPAAVDPDGKLPPPVRHIVLTDAATKLPDNPQRRFLHHLRAVVHAETAGEWFFQVGIGDGWDNDLRVLQVDGDTGNTVVPGWFTVSYGSTVTVKGSGTRQLSAGRHVIDLYTTRDLPDVQIRTTADGALQLLDGRFAHYDNAVMVTPGPFTTKADDDPATIAAAVAEEWIVQQRYAAARLVCRRAAQRWPGAADRFEALSETAQEGAYAADWMMVSKVPARTGYVGDQVCAPPFRLERKIDMSGFHERLGGNAVWSEEGLQMGMRFKLFREAWLTTGGVCVQDGILFCGFKDGRMCAVDEHDGQLKWQFPGAGPCYGAPLAYRGQLFYGGLDRRLYCLSIDQGRMQWNYPTSGWVEGSPAALDGTVYVGCRNGSLYAVDAALGVERWQLALGGAVLGTPACASGTVVAGTESGMLYAVDAHSGEPRWTYQAAGAITGGVCIGGGTVVFGDGTGQVQALDLSTGKPRWTTPCAVGGTVVAAPIMVGDVIYGGCSDSPKCWGIDLASGQLGWHYDLPSGAVRWPLVFAHERLVIAASGRGAPGSYARFPAGAEPRTYVLAPGRPTQLLPRLSAPPVIDGGLDESWQAVPSLDALRCRNGMQIGAGGTARVAWDEAALYLVVETAEPGVSGLQLVLDPRRNGLAALVITVPVSGQASYHLETGLSTPPDGDLQAALAKLSLPAPEALAVQLQTATQGEPGRWTVELALPFAGLPTPLFDGVAADRKWHANLILQLGASGGSRAWAPTAAAAPLGTPQRWGELTFK